MATQEGRSRKQRYVALALSCAGVTCVVIVHALPLSESTQWAVSIGGALLVLLGVLRLYAQLAEHDRLLHDERALRENGVAYRVLFDQASDGIFFSDRSGK